MGRSQLSDRDRAGDRGRPRRPQPKQAIHSHRDHAGLGVTQPRDIGQPHAVAGRHPLSWPKLRDSQPIAARQLRGHRRIAEPPRQSLALVAEIHWWSPHRPMDRVAQAGARRGGKPMLKDTRAGAMIPTQDLARAKEFYEGKLGLTPEDDPGGVLYRCAEGTAFAVFLSSGKTSGTHTQLGFD